MIVVHAAMHEGRLFVWGESSLDDHPTGKKKAPKRVKQDGKAKRCSFDGGTEGVVYAFAETGVEFKLNAKRFQDLTVWLPTRGETPIPSSPMIAEAPVSKAKTRVVPWLVSGYPLLWDEVVDFLCRCSGKKLLAPGMLSGADLAFWCEALRFSGSLVAQQHYLPSVNHVDEFRAIWQPVYFGDDADALAQLAKRMPPVARAITLTEATQPASVAPLELLKSFVDASLDQLVRSSKCGKPSTLMRNKKPVFDSIHDAWLHALQAPDNRIAGATPELALLAQKVREWSRPIAVTASAPLRLCFRLEEPVADDSSKPGRTKSVGDSWHVRYLLQPQDDLSLLIPLEDAWKSGAAKNLFIKKIGPKLKESVLTSLGQASSICPDVTKSLKVAQPSGYDLDAQGAHAFLSETALILQQSGFKVLLPAWWAGKSTKLNLSVRANVKTPKLKTNSGLSLATIVEFDWETAIGGEKVSLEELKALAKLKAPLVQIRGQWVEIDPEQIQAAVDIWAKKGTERTSIKDMIQMALRVKDGPRGIQIDRVRATGWIGKLLNQLETAGKIGDIQPNERFSGTLRPYQLRGLSWLGFLSQWGMGACLADDMGLGKTVQTLALVQRQWNSSGKKPVLLVCPTTVVNNWQKEAARFTPDLPVLIHHGVGRGKGAVFKKNAKKHAVVISSFGLLHRDIKLFQDIEWGGIVLDEAQNIKNPETKQARAARSVKADYRIALTGTPVENNVGDLWSIMEFLNPGFLGSQAEFKRKFFVPIQAERDPTAVDRLKRITGPFILRRLKTDRSIIADLPDKLEMKLFCPLTKEQASLYAAVVRDTEETLKSSEGIQRKGLILATLSKLKQVCNHPAHFLGDNSAIPGRSGKVARLTEMLEEVLGIEERALVFTQFAEMGNLLQRHLQGIFGIEVLFLHGGITKQKRDRMVERFQHANEGPSIFILSLKAGGTGLNLTAANHVFHFDRWWNPAVENQATDRVFRIGQTKNVQVHKFVCAGTLEEKIDEMIEQKKTVAEQVVGAGEGWITELSNKDLKQLWKLRKEAVGE